jgi:hypothetical protein
MAMGALVSVKDPPSSFTLSAVFQAMEFSSSAPKMMPRLPASKLNPMVVIVWSASKHYDDSIQNDKGLNALKKGIFTNSIRVSILESRKNAVYCFDQNSRKN